MLKFVVKASTCRSVKHAKRQEIDEHSQLVIDGFLRFIAARSHRECGCMTFELKRSDRLGYDTTLGLIGLSLQTEARARFTNAITRNRIDLSLVARSNQPVTGFTDYQRRILESTPSVPNRGWLYQAAYGWTQTVGHTALSVTDGPYASEFREV